MGKKVSTFGQRGFRFLEVLFLVFFVAGIVGANIYGGGRLQKYGIINSYFVQQLKYVDINKQDFMIYIMTIRIPVMFLLFILGMTVVYKLVHGMFVSWLGFAFGFLFVTAISNLGIKAIALVLMSLFPHYFFYTASYMGLVYLQWNYHERYQKKKFSEWILVAGIIGMLFCVGIITEAYINPACFQFMLKKF